MHRRQILGGAGGLFLSLAGCLDNTSGPPGTTESPAESTTEFELVDAEVPSDDPPVVRVEEGTVTVRGTVRYGSSSCGTVKLAHAEYEDSQDRLDLLIVAADATEDVGECTDDLVATGYRIETTVADRLRRVAATEHHVFGDVYSTTTDLTEY